MYKIIKGVLHRNGKPVFAIGESYYPSFHHAKYPVPPEGDRDGEMKKDLKAMAEMGFNHVRFAGLGTLRLENGEAVPETPFVDSMIREAENDGLSVSVRLQGYVINLRGFENVLMIDAEGREQDVSRWFDFIQTTLHHPGIIEDDAAAASALASHFSGFPEVVAFQIYNEPHYPSGLFDYHPLAIEAYRKELVKKQLLTEAEAKTYDPPRGRKEQSAEAWARWRCFSADALTRFLSQSGSAAKEAADLPVYTCFTSCQAGTGNVFRGCDVFGGARSLDIAGFTSYFSAEGADYYPMEMFLNMNVSAAMLEGKEAWIIELDSRTKIPPHIFNQNTSAAVGSGVKGILYYQWRGDYPSPATPIPNGCGLVNYDGSRTANYENAERTVALLNSISDWLVGAKKLHQGVGVLVSNYGAFYADAKENDGEPMKESRNSYISIQTQIYTQLRKSGIGVTMADAEALRRHGEQFRVLFVPRRAYLSPEEDELLRMLQEKGVSVYEIASRQSPSAGLGLMGYEVYGAPQALYRQYMTMEDVLYKEQLKPLAETLSPFTAMQVLVGDGYRVLCVTNISNPHRTVGTDIRLQEEIESAVRFDGAAPEGAAIKNNNNIIHVDNVADAAYIVIKLRRKEYSDE